MNGICLWHLPFYSKISGSLEYYLVNRNSLITQAVSGILEKNDFAERIRLMYGEEIRKFNYCACGQLLDALDDFLMGPEYISGLDGEEVIRRQGAKNERMFPQGDFGFPVRWDEAYDRMPLDGENLELFIRTDNGHTLPDRVLVDSDPPPTVATLFFESPGKQYLRRRLIAADVHNRVAALRVMDREKYRALGERKERLFSRYASERDALTAEYRAASERLHSESFWKRYLSK
jgi:hypothetical protein